MVNYRDPFLDDLLETIQETKETSEFQEDQLICECHVIGLVDLKNLVCESKKVDLEYIMAETRLGSGCRSCLKNSAWWLKELK